MAEAVVGRFPDAVAARLNKFDQEIQAIVSRKILYAEGALAALGVDVAGVNVRLSEDSTGYTVESKAD